MLCLYYKLEKPLQVVYYREDVADKYVKSRLAETLYSTEI